MKPIQIIPPPAFHKESFLKGYEIRTTELENTWAKIMDTLENHSTNLDPEIIKLVDQHFWDLTIN